MRVDLKTVLKDDALFKFYSWMKLSSAALYMDLVMGFIFRDNYLNMETLITNLELSQIIYFILLGAALFPILASFVYIAHGTALMINGIIFEVITHIPFLYSSCDIGYKKTNTYELHYDELKDFALRKNNQVAYAMAIDCKNSYAIKRLNKYITVAALILLCFDINIGGIMSHIIIWSTWVKTVLYILVGVVIYFLLRKLAMYNNGHYVTKSEELYNEVRETISKHNLQ